LSCWFRKKRIEKTYEKYAIQKLKTQTRNKKNTKDCKASESESRIGHKTAHSLNEQLKTG
jgi:hypothetical protein